MQMRNHRIQALLLKWVPLTERFPLYGRAKCPTKCIKMLVLKNIHLLPNIYSQCAQNLTVKTFFYAKLRTKSFPVQYIYAVSYLFSSIVLDVHCKVVFLKLITIE